MRRQNITLLFILFMSMIGSFATTTIKVVDQKMSQGSEKSIKFMVNTDEGNLLAFQMGLTLPEGLSLATYTQDGYELVDATLVDADSHDIIGAWNGDSYMFVCKSDQNEPLPPEFLVSLKLKAGNGAKTGVANIGNVLFSQKVGDEHRRYEVDDGQFNVAIGRVELDETQTVAPLAISHADVSVKRTINCNEWSTICLPFSMSEAQVKAAFGDKVKLAEFMGYEAKREQGEVVGITVKFKNRDVNEGIESNHPYLIQTQADLSVFTADGVDVQPQEKPTVAAVTRSSTQWSEMTGTYAAGSFVPENCLFISDNKFWYSTGQTPIMAYRAYFDFSDVLDLRGEASGRVVLEVDGEATFIDAISQDVQQDCETYNLKGQRVDGTGRGLYIINGKKVIK